MSLRALLLIGLILSPLCARSQGVAGRVPATPIIPHNPYFSIWNTSDSLHQEWTRHWTGKTNGIAALLRVDGTTYRLMGVGPRGTPAARQISRRIFPTRTVYEFSAGGVHCLLTFMLPQLPWDADLLSWPVCYASWELQSEEGNHEAAFYFDITAEATVNTPDQRVTWGRARVSGAELLRVGSQAQEVLGKRGDDLRIDWGYLTLAVREGSGLAAAIGGHNDLRSRFAAGQALGDDDLRMPRSANDNWPVLACAEHPARLERTPRQGTILLGYDDQFSIQYFHRNLPAYWKRNGATFSSLVNRAFSVHDSLRNVCSRFDDELMADALAAGGEEYRDIAVLAYRQCLAAHTIVADLDGTMLMFSKENFSNGCIGTVDVIYPASPQFLLLNPTLLKAQLTPLLQYASLPRWKFPFAPHDLGTYPHANGQVYGGGEETEENQMPVEESGNMLLMVAGVAVADRSPEYALAHWPVLQQWAEYLKSKGRDPENQLCTDDFAGHLAHNVNLSAKAILALGAYAELCRMAGKSAEEKSYRRTAEDFVKEWSRMAEDGDHTRLAFDRPGTWSQKYNLVWDRILGLHLFPPDVARREIQYYRTRQNAYGLPLDNRKEYTKLDWILWTASLAESDADFRAFVSPVAKFLRETPDRVPMTDWYWTTTGAKVGFQARSVVGGVLVKMLLDPAITARWRARVR